MPSRYPRAIEFLLPWGPVVRGEGWGDGPGVVLLLHEPGSDIDAWGALPAKLAPSLDLQVIAVDLPGHGLSDCPWEPSRAAELVRVLVEGDRSGLERYVVAAGNLASAALQVAESVNLRGVICLSPELAEGPMPRSPRVPKLFFTGSLAGDDLATARSLAAKGGGWAVVTSVPVAARGTALLASEWAIRVEEEVVAFVRDCRRRPRIQRRGSAPRSE